ncbi:glucose dehydrogenase [FAD, quinone]-like [Mizuhopecten yessoensis]|uniref:Glucose dehydrogenase [acceptor] n=1 Tax=Mizuhopecten yessoensis TaxID=6573 RepID=A0A210PMB7_MIZYE|nr:glucose dehydrogenase [FAD, quinone]-like [Mizuhopecten yessoensis]XP_021379820.1 glucose dehydrogenase [FAD, quinone]-like [Mizuhopecten yessoensis]XP_021379821.1 glucose dehydrogenase [FAD, quinone]-like [Mizuhopecten yessoensis]OWF37635.1 Glucose dehydrogenase [acceptor] [Mizuhopecten yessoensis]
MNSTTFCLILVLAVLTSVLFMRDSGPQPTKQLNDTYDYIIVGAGSAGSVLATRLSEDTGSTVLVLEAGNTGENNWFINVPLVSALTQKSNEDWNYQTEPQQHAAFAMKERRSCWPRGKVLGGTSALNMMVYARGSRYDYDSWAEEGCEGWSYQDVLPYFLKSEDVLIDELKNSAFHSSGGELGVSRSSYTALPSVLLQAGQELGFKAHDCHGPDQIGFCRMQATVRDGKRSSTYNSILKPAMSRANLHVGVNSLVTKVLIHDGRAEGVEVMREGRTLTVHARKEVILSGGAVNSPQLLMLSGVGPRDHLEDMEIDVKADLPVGDNLQDHLMVFIPVLTNTSIPITKDTVGNVWALMDYVIHRTGVIATTGVEAMAFLYEDGNVTSGNGKAPEIQFHLHSVHGFTENEKQFENFNLNEKTRDLVFSTAVNQSSFSMLPILLHPKSHGTLRLKSKDPLQYPAIDPQYLQHPGDIKTLLKGIRLTERLLDTKPMREIGASIDPSVPMYKLCEQHLFRSDAFWMCFIRQLAVTVYHPTGTCRIGRKDDPTAVVDPQLKVKGIKGLRVVDASVMRNMPSGNTNAPSIMIAEKAADMIRGVDTVQRWKQQIRGHL